MTTLETSDTGASALLGGAGDAGDAGTVASSPAAADGGAAPAADGGATAGAELQIAEWMKGFGTDPMEPGGPSAAEWIAKAGFKDPSAVAKAARDAQRELRTFVPTDTDPPEKWSAFFQKIGRPESAEGYKVTAPEGFEANPEFTGRFRDVVFNAGLAERQVSALVDWYNQETMTNLAQEAAQLREQQAALRREWGADFSVNIELVKRGMQVLGMNNAELDKMGRGMGIGPAFAKLMKLGQMTSEDVLRNPAANPGFTVSIEEAEAKLTDFNKSPEKAAKLRAKDPAVMAEQQRLIAQVAAARDAKAKR